MKKVFLYVCLCLTAIATKPLSAMNEKQHTEFMKRQKNGDSFSLGDSAGTVGKQPTEAPWIHNMKSCSDIVPLPPELQDILGCEKVHRLSFEKILNFACRDDKKLIAFYSDLMSSEETSKRNIIVELQELIFSSNFRVLSTDGDYLGEDSPIALSYKNYLFDTMIQDLDKDIYVKQVILFMAAFHYKKSTDSNFFVDLRHDDNFCANGSKVCLRTREGLYPRDIDWQHCMTMPQDNDEKRYHGLSFLIPQSHTVIDAYVVWHELWHLMFACLGISPRNLALKELFNHPWIKRLLFPGYKSCVDLDTDGVLNFMESLVQRKRFVSAAHYVNSYLEEVDASRLSPEESENFKNLRQRILGQLFMNNIKTTEDFRKAFNTNSAFKIDCMNAFSAGYYLYMPWENTEEIFNIYGILFKNGEFFLNPFNDNAKLWTLNQDPRISHIHEDEKKPLFIPQNINYAPETRDIGILKELLVLES